MSAALTAEQAERARTWHAAIVELLEGVKPRLQGDWWRWRGKGSLCVNKHNGVWYDHEAGCGGISTAKLVAHLKGESLEQGAAFVDAWLESHQGSGTCTGSADEIDHVELAKAILERAVSITDGDLATQYLKSRGLEPRYPVCLKFLPNARVGEAGLVAILVANGRTVGCQVTYINAHGCKSLVEPMRRRYGLEKAPGAFCHLEPLCGPAGAPMVIAEGIEDGLSLACVHPGEIRAIPGIGALQHTVVPKGRGITVFRDGDPPDAPSTKSLWRGVDRLLLQGAHVSVTATPQEQDANSLLCAGSVEVLRQVLEQAVPAKLSREGRCEAAARLDKADYDRERAAIAKEFGLRRPTVDELTDRHRPKKEAEKKRCKGVSYTEPWHEPIDDLGAVLDKLRAAIRKHVVLPEYAADLAALWAAHTWAYDRFDNTARLAIVSPAMRCGKTTLLRVLKLVCRRVLTADNITAAVVFRVVEQEKPVTLLLDEYDTYGLENKELRGVVNSGFERDGHVPRVEDTKDGRVAVFFSTYAPVAIASIGKVPETIRDRATPIFIERKARTDSVTKLRAPGAKQILQDIASQLARWFADHTDDLNENPTIPNELGDREGDNVVALLSIAEAAGGEWIERARKVVLKVYEAGAVSEDVEETGTLLLQDIRTIFAAQTKGSLEARQLSSLYICTELEKMTGRPWPEWGKQAKPISQNQLARELRHFKASADTGVPIMPMNLKWPATDGGQEKVTKGYKPGQFAEAWGRYLDFRFSHSSITPPSRPLPRDNPQETAENGEFEPLPVAAGSGSESAEKPQSAATYSAVAVQPGGLERNIESELRQEADLEYQATEGAQKLNGIDGISPASEIEVKPSAPLSETSVVTPIRRRLPELIRQAHAKDPKLTVDKLCKKFGRPTNFVVEALEGKR